MPVKQLYIFVEGRDDILFFEQVIKPKLESAFDYIKIIEYRQKKYKFIRNLINVNNKMGGDYIFVADMNDCPCVTVKKEKLVNKCQNLDQNKICIVIKKIEGWYLAGLDKASCNELKLKGRFDSEKITKERFKDLIPKSFDSAIDFKQEILKRFSIEKAIAKNRSFKYFAEKYKIA